jgi:sulfur carrier protein
MKIKLNGQESSTQSHTIEELLRETDAPEKGIAVARNGAVVRRIEYSSTPVEENDDIEIIRAVQGG